VSCAHKETRSPGLDAGARALRRVRRRVRGTGDDGPPTLSNARRPGLYDVSMNTALDMAIGVEYLVLGPQADIRSPTMTEQIRFPPRIRGASVSTASAGASANGAAPGGVRRAAAASLG